jgi:hypothetical protein
MRPVCQYILDDLASLRIWQVWAPRDHYDNQSSQNKYIVDEICPAEPLARFRQLPQKYVGIQYGWPRAAAGSRGETRMATRGARGTRREETRMAAGSREWPREPRGDADGHEQPRGAARRRGWPRGAADGHREPRMAAGSHGESRGDADGRGSRGETQTSCASPSSYPDHSLPGPKFSNFFRSVIV